MNRKEFRELESIVDERGIDSEILKAIRNSSICIIDDKAEDLKSFEDGLKREGFNNLKIFETVPSINSLLSENYDLIILDLNDIAKEISKEDGVGVLRMIKERRPEQLIILVSGKSVSVEENEVISRANLVRKKPILASDLTSDVENLLKVYFDKYWASIAVLKELHKIDSELSDKLSFFKRIKLGYHRKNLVKMIRENDNDVLLKLEKIKRIVQSVKSIYSPLELIISKILK